ncbi:hypothetical protein EZJ49_01420 [Bdellovibrio bacteriovorus]|uniref:hypothetical protein n=1 Tax=Bdellovibrio bacteriovorus TaxID=959 RepID=UPI0021CFCAE5|nr:hypothetical protein [Bdellovibrio bacteriovorus]UXR64909.1 hypothetical protein EZJ49_01420 [Bdellovibrio bacteriovorus]
MMHVTGKKLSIFLFTCFLVVGCKDPELEMSPLGKKLPAPTLKGTNPFEQDFDSQNYARIQGSCDTRVSTVFISFDKNIWHQAPATPDITGTSLPSGQTNDVNCSDGTFDIYLTKNDLLHLWGINSGSDDVDAIYIKGLSAIGDTEMLSLLDMTPGNGGGNGDGGSAVATTINLEKNWPRGYAGANQCGSFFVYLSNSSGHQATHTSDITFGIKQSLSGNNGTAISAHSNWVDCHSGANTTDTFKIPAGANYAEVIYRFPSSPVDGLLSFSLVSPSALTASPVAANVILRSSEDTSLQRWLSLDQTVLQLYKNVCYPFRLRSQMYNNNPADDQFGGTLSVTATDARLKFYSNESCTTRATELTFASYDPVLKGYMKFVPSGTDTESFVTFQVTATGATGNTYSYDTQPLEFRADLSDKNIVTKLDFQGPRDVVNGECHLYQVAAMNANGTLLPVSANLTVNLDTAEDNLGQFFSDEGCGTPTSSISINKGKSSTLVYFNPAATTAGTYHFNITAAGLTPATPLVVIHSIARQFKIVPMDLTSGSCKAISVGVVDGAGILKPVSSAVSTTLQIYLTPGGSAQLYADANCSTAIAGGTAPVTIPQGGSIGTVYMNTTGLAGTAFTIYVNSSSGYYGSDFNGVFN